MFFNKGMAARAVGKSSQTLNHSVAAQLPPAIPKYFCRRTVDPGALLTPKWADSSWPSATC